MAKPERNVYRCQACGHKSPKWLGRCPECGEWNTLAEEKEAPKRASAAFSVPEPLSKVHSAAGGRVSTRMGELDRVLGGGVVMGSVVLVGGDPGIGKSTILLQAASRMPGPTLYVSAEESAEQIKARADRLRIDEGPIVVLPEISLEHILAETRSLNPSALIVDSIQTVYTDELSGAPGSVGQVRESAAKLMRFAKTTGVPVFIVGHVTKEGMIAGPRVLEHIVDTVLYFEGHRGQTFRILRAVKNRFGSTNEIGVFEMTDAGLAEVENPSELFLAERPVNVSGSVVAASMEGTRPLLVELQALVSASTYSVSRRSSLGIDFQRVGMILAVLEKVAGLHLAATDVFLNVVGGLKLEEPAVDLAVCAAVVSSLREKPVPPEMFTFGEIGLSGEVRAVNHAEARLKEASKIGLKRAVIPRGNRDKLKGKAYGLEILGVKDVHEAMETLFS
ncbi:MAG: DNA repair protein RadA [Nitrospiraceae bacterium]|nr:DNA repair protein RadA [Nitrospiraceae bacterium]